MPSGAMRAPRIPSEIYRVIPEDDEELEIFVIRRKCGKRGPLERDGMC